jgi:hypothetical protein
MVQPLFGDPVSARAFAPNAASIATMAATGLRHIWSIYLARNPGEPRVLP